MATYYLINTILVGTTKLFAGSYIDSAVQDTDLIVASGGKLWPSENEIIAAAALEATNARKFRGANETECNAIMIAAVGQVVSSLGSTLAGLGASIVGIEDAGGYYTEENVEGALQEIGAVLGPIVPPAAADVTVVDAGNYFAGTEVEAVLQEIGAVMGPVTPPTAAMVSVADAGGYFTGVDVEAVLQEIGAVMGPVVPPTAAVVTVVDAGNYFTGADVEAVLQEVGAIITAPPAPPPATLFKETVVLTAATIAALGAVLSGVINVGAMLPVNARFLGANVNVATKVQDAGDVDVTTVDVGVAGDVSRFVAGASLKTTGDKGNSSAGTATGWASQPIGGAQAIATITSTVNLDTITAGAATVDLFYFVMA